MIMYQYEEDMNKIYDLMRVHNDWMRDSVNLIASENTTSNAVTTAMASDLAHRYAEGQAYERLYQGCTYIDQIEDITKQLSCKVYDCSYANVQPVSGVTANLAAFFGFAKAGDKMIAMNIPYGGHISHANVSAAGIRGLKTLEHPFNPEVMNIDADALNKMILEEKPKIILFGGSLFLFPHPVSEVVDAANEVGATIMYDGAHVLGLIAGKQFQDPLKEGAEVLMGSTHKTFPGPQGGIILSDKKNEKLIDNAVFPGVVSNHHLHHLAGLGIATAEILEFGEAYAKQTIKNAKALAGALAEQGFNVLCEDLGYTESHQVGMDVRDVKRATILAKELEQNNIILNKNLIPGDNVNDSDDPSGIRIGTQEITRRGMKEKEMEEVAEFIWRVAEGDKVDIKDEVTEFMSGYRTIHYAFTEEEGYKFIEHI